MNMNVKPRINGPRASGIITVKMIRSGEAPMDFAASITPGSMVTRFCSTMRAAPKVAAITMPNTAAFRPIRLPTRASLNGPMAVSKMMNGIGRTKFTRKLITQ